MENKYDIFISYRRDNGEDKARILNQFLSTVGYRVFFDHESGMTGEFETKILAAVEIAPLFLMLLTPHCFDRCNEEDDWVRREIEKATLYEKDIIPIRPNYDDSMFKNLPEGVPDCVLRLSKLEFAEIDFHKNFKATAGNMVEEQIKKVVQPSIAIADTGNRGAGVGAKMHKKEEVYDVFISYYKDTGLQCAKNIHQLLTKEGYSVFFNEDSVREGFEDEDTLIHVKRCKDLILIVDTKFANKINCREDDWVKAELTEAIKRGPGIVNIIPILLQSDTILPNGILINDDAISFPKPVKAFDLIGNRNTLFDRLNSRRMYVNERNARRLQVNYDYSTITEQSIREMTNNPLFAFLVQAYQSSEKI